MTYILRDLWFITLNHLTANKYSNNNMSVNIIIIVLRKTDEN